MIVFRIPSGLGAVTWLACAILTVAAPQPAAAQAERCLAVEFYYRGGDEESERALRIVETQLGQRRGIQLVRFDLAADPTRAERLKKIASFFKLDPHATPFLYACNQAIQGCADENQFTQQVEGLTRMEVFVRAGCPRCARAKTYLPDLAARYPALDIVYYEITSDRDAARYVQELARDYGQGAASVPVFHFCRQLIVGFDGPRGTGSRIESVLTKWSHPCRRPAARPRNEESGAAPPWRSRYENAGSVLVELSPLLLTGYLAAAPPPIAAEASAADDAEVPLEEPQSHVEGEQAEDADLLPLPLPGEDLSDSDSGTLDNNDEGAPLPTTAQSESDSFDVPLVGRFSASQLGLPLFTIVIGLVDGFNPCAMWVLMFLLSILVNLRSRSKIIAVAGTFVLISGLIYFAFMAAWLSVFQWIGLLRPVQITLALVAITVGLIHIKDFFAFKQGISLSIPEAAKPGIYARVRRIVTAENLVGAILGASVLAVMVNFIELLCTAGLPALYTEILTVRQLPQWQNYAYLALYNVAYMFDDALMVAAVVITLSKTKMQEHHGRVLKLISGAFILVLGAVMLVKPEWLV